jgi:hypothetical protein
MCFFLAGTAIWLNDNYPASIAKCCALKWNADCYRKLISGGCSSFWSICQGYAVSSSPMFENVLNESATYEGKEVIRHKEQTIDEAVQSKVPIVSFSPSVSFIYLSKHL